MKGTRLVKKNYPQIAILSMLVLLIFWFAQKDHYFESLPHATVVMDVSGDLLSAHLASDGQWRFPMIDSLPDQFVTCLKLYEDAYFDSHPGINPVSLFRALWQNINQGKVVSGGSTITMQTVRLARKPGNRSILQKLKEMFWALRLELHYSKEEILKMHASNAPFGGNVIGLETASWRYFKRDAFNLSWAEYAMLAVLPNAPGLIHPGRNRQELTAKRNRLLLKLLNEELIDQDQYQLSLLEKVPLHPHPLPQRTPQLLQYLSKKGGRGKRISTTINDQLQGGCQSILDRYLSIYAGDQIFNGAILVADIESGQTLAYVGNGSLPEYYQKSYWVDIIQSERSTGSVLKPFLYAAMLHEGQILPNSMVEDVPTYLSGYAPKNYGKDYDGVVPASMALSRSLNVPAVRMLKDYSYPKFHSKLRKLGMRSLHRPPSHYGLSLILGGAEGTLWDICGMYASMGRMLLHQEHHNLEYRNNDLRPLTLRVADREKYRLSWETELSAAAIWQTFEAMEKVHRPENQVGWKRFESSRKIAWKTGTSFGYRDAWAVGVDGRHVVGVWIGNADGTGRDGLVGLRKAAPILFEVFGNLPRSAWFPFPVDDHKSMSLCSKSGYPASVNCVEKEVVSVPDVDFQGGSCPFHKMVHLDASRSFQVHSSCESTSEIIHESWFVLPPVQEYYFAKKHPWYRVLPQMRSDCNNGLNRSTVMSFIYPENFSKVKIPRELDGSRSALVVKLAHQQAQSRVFWYLDRTFLGETTGEHELSISPTLGLHTITVVDQDGESSFRQFQVVE